MKKNDKLSRAFQQWLLGLVTVAFLISTLFLWGIQTQLSEENAINLLELNISDVRQDIIDASDENLLSIARQVANTLEEMGAYEYQYLVQLLFLYDLSEINIIDQTGHIISSTNFNFLGFDMDSGAQSREFLCLLNGADEYVQSYQPISYDSGISCKYGGVVLPSGGFVQVGYDAQRFQRDIHSNMIGIARNRHVGQNGFILIADEQMNVVSDRMGSQGLPLSAVGLAFTTRTTDPGVPFSSTVYGQECYCMYQFVEGYYVVAVIPQSEAVLSRNVSVGITTAMEVLVFASLFVMIYILIKKLVVDNLLRVNAALSQITDGDLDTVVDVRSHEEFSSLSDDINATVDTLKKYIADAEARIDAELAFAKAIQHSALPSVFPPYPNHREFEIHATMHTAKEVGGDFYDFYFIDEENLAFLIADVSGKGIPAAMFMMQSKTILKSLAESGMSVEQVFTHANEKLCEGNDANMFVTAWMGVLNTRTGKVLFSNAGHNPPLVKHADGSFEYLKSRAGFILAGMEGIRYRKNELQLDPGDVIYLYTDGVTEATDLDNQLYGEERLQAVLEKHKNETPQLICDLVKTDVDTFVGEAPQFDDITMLTLRYNGTEADK